MTTPAGQQQLLSTKPNDLNNPKTRTNFETKLVYQLPLFTGFKLSSAKDMARLQIEAQKAKFQYDEKQLSLEVLKAYNGAVAAKYFIYATQKAKKATLSFVTFAQEMYNEGYITNIDVDQARLYDLKIDSMLIEAKNKYALAIAYLKFLTNDTTITDVEDFQTIKVNNVDVNTLQKNALKYRADLEWMKHNNLTMKKKIDYEKSGNYPMIGAHFEYGLNDNQLNNFNTSKEYFVAAVGIEYEIFNGLITKTAVNKAKIGSAQTNHYYQMMEDGVKLQVEKAYLNLQTNSKILKEKIKAEQLANSVLARSQELYKNQLIKMNDLLLEQANLQKARAETILAKYNKTIAAAELKLAVGKDLIKE
jgi:outer membrane protein TolC